MSAEAGGVVGRQEIEWAGRGRQEGIVGRYRPYVGGRQGYIVGRLGK